jgi:hypothetical protein
MAVNFKNQDNSGRKIAVNQWQPKAWLKGEKNFSAFSIQVLIFTSPSLSLRQISGQVCDSVASNPYW